MQQRGRIFSSPFFFLLLAILCPFLLLPLGEYLALAPFGSETFRFAELLAPLHLLALILGFAVSPLLTVFRPLRTFALGCAWICGLGIVAFFAGIWMAGRVRNVAFHDLARRSATLVQAIRAYESQEGAPPPDLSALVPRFLAAIPGTGMASYPEYEYHRGQRAADYAGNPWVLVVFTPVGIVNFDEFLYFPLQNYPDRGYGGDLERIADWAYLHE